MKPWLRWILVLPAAVGAYVAIQIIVSLLDFLHGFSFYQSSKQWTYLANSIVGPIVFIWFGCKTAPRFKGYVSSCLCGLMSFCLLAWMIRVFSFRRYEYTRDSEFWLLIGGAALGIISSILTAVAVHQKENEAAPKDQ